MTAYSVAAAPVITSGPAEPLSLSTDRAALADALLTTGLVPVDRSWPGMLLRLADQCHAHRPLLIERNSRIDLELFDEHEQTLRSLATTPIPGLDALSPFTR
ncbi:hypothetical protein CFP71_10040 [Amycolatopsis thailandensis]|uniref:Uncharacterized protein n=1 Tax=Amycolatopsis thailandensis TaxID=589330 RepID=A0A229SDU2_9PSEU|nr:hypothetical protein [Amycolatopsis thailandensis]OXM57066.1 hypothetical protein CFP71_10040 [Amycolatopsis thailandensis]